MDTINIVYDGQLRCRTLNKEMKPVITDAPKQFGGKEEAFSPTDVIAIALASCMLTMMGMAAHKNGVSLKGTTVEATKDMVDVPARRIGIITLVFHMPAGIDSMLRKVLEDAAYSCPVYKSLHPDIKHNITFKYPDKSMV
jgi:putative redox protein